MLRKVLAMTTLATALTAAALAQPRTQGFGRAGNAWCNDGGNGDRASFCEVREETVSGVNPLDVDAGHNGGIRVRGWDRGDVLVRARIVGYADTDAEARRVVSAIRLVTAGGSVRADGPDTSRSGNWSVSFEIQVPRTALLTLNTNNGGIAIEDFQGTAKFRAHNGGIRMTLPEHYSAALETGTTHGRVNVDFPLTVQGRFDRRLSTTLGAGGATIRAITTNGGVTIRRR